QSTSVGREKRRDAGMGRRLNRRDFVRTTAAAGIAAAPPGTLFGQTQASPAPGMQGPTVMTPKSIRPVVISSANGNRFKNGGPVTCVEKAFQMITSGSDVLDAVIAGVNIVELDPQDTRVGLGGLAKPEA